MIKRFRIILRLPIIMLFVVASCLYAANDRNSVIDQFAANYEDVKKHPGDIKKANHFRMFCKDHKLVDKCIDSFKELVDSNPDMKAVIYNAALAYIDKLKGYSLLKQGWFSTRSINLIDKAIAQDPSDWLAYYLKGMNNLYWPTWFNRTEMAIKDLEQSVALIEQQPEKTRKAYDALPYIALGDAYVKAGQFRQSRRAWQEGLKINTNDRAINERLKRPDDQLTKLIEDKRDLNKDIDTDLSFLWEAESKSHNVYLTGGTLYGPGPLPDQQLKPGLLSGLVLKSFLDGAIEPFNNKGEEPNVSGEILQGKVIDGAISDGTLINEHIDVGHVKIMNDKFDLLLTAVFGGPNEGRAHFYLDSDLNWTIRDDIAIDPGFTAGVIKFSEFIWSTGPRAVPISTQTKNGYPGGVNRCGSLKSGDVIMGKLGDDDFDGYLDGLFNAIGSFRLNSIILPGAPFVQIRTIKTDIAVSSIDAALLTVAGARNYLKKAEEINHESDQENECRRLIEEAGGRLAIARKHIANSLEKIKEGSLQSELDVIGKMIDSEGMKISDGTVYLNCEDTIKGVNAILSRLIALSNYGDKQ